jgi:hypothetical protein
MKELKYNVFNLPVGIKATLRPFTVEHTARSVLEDSRPTEVSQILAGAVCTYCGEIPNSDDVNAQRQHYKTDYHRFNIKRRLKNLQPVSEQDFEKLLEQLDDNESISGSDTDSSEDDDEITTLMNKTNVTEPEATDTEVATTLKGSPYLLFSSEDLSDDKCLAVYKALTKPSDNSLERFKSIDPNGMSAVFMIGGGHFAGAVISHQINPKNPPTHTNPYTHLQLIEHKSFHRYTTRRKQGGAQGTNDNARGKANSAGSSLRRYNEMALQQEVRELINSWSGLLGKCANIYIRANGRTNRQVMVNYEGGPLVSTDARIRGLPFTTRRATTTEIKRAWVELTEAKVIDRPVINEEAEKPGKPQSQPQRTQPTPAVSKPELSENENHTIEVTSLIKKSRSPRLISYFKSYKLSPNFELEPTSQYENSTSTTLHYAAVHGTAHVITTLLMSVDADPTIRNKQGRTAYDLATDRAIKDAFQLARATLGEDKWNWAVSKVGPALTKRQIQDRDGSETQQLQENRRKDLEKLEKREESKKLERTIAKHGQGKKLSSSVVTQVATSQELNVRGLSEEGRMKLERERRARAAEARFRTIK